MALATAPVATRLGDLLKHWRARRRLSQLDLALQAGVSTRHLSFLETGRSKPSRELLLHLAEQLDVPLRERNALLLAAGYAPVYRRTALDDPEMASVRQAIDLILRGHEPLPAVVVDHRWDLVAANAGVDAFLGLLPPTLLEPPINVIRASLHPDGLAPLIVNFEEYAGHLVGRLRRQLEASGDTGLDELLTEALAYPGVAASEQAVTGGVVLPLRLALPDGPTLAFFSTMTVFGAPLDVTVSELAVESFYPADEATATALRSPAA
jgi:transcriptional regulator with XRE-family HTH domain